MRVCVSCGGRFCAEDWDCPTCGFSPQYRHGYPVFCPARATDNGGYNPEYFADILAREDSFWLLARKRLFVWALRCYFPHATSFLDIGCATGALLSYIHEVFPALMLWGTEIHSAGLDFLQERLPDVSVFQADAREIPFAEEFDVIGAFDVLEHVEEDVRVLGQLYQATKPGGGILVSVPQHPFLWSQRDEHLCHRRRYTRRQLVEKINSVGFEILRITSFVSLLFPLMLLASIRNRNRRNGYDPFAELKIGRWAQLTMTQVLTIERQLIKAGFSFPWGGSLFLVAKRNRVNTIS